MVPFSDTCVKYYLLLEKLFRFFFISVTYSLSSSESMIFFFTRAMKNKNFVIYPNKLEWESTCFGHFQPGIIYPHPWLWNSVDLFNWVPDRWFQCFQDSISNHFAHIAKLALKKGKELLCCINIPSELLAVKGMKKWRKSREKRSKNMLLEIRNVSNVLMVTDYIIISI